MNVEFKAGDFVVSAVLCDGDEDIIMEMKSEIIDWVNKNVARLQMGKSTNHFLNFKTWSGILELKSNLIYRRMIQTNSDNFGKMCWKMVF